MRKTLKRKLTITVFFLSVKIFAIGITECKIAIISLSRIEVTASDLSQKDTSKMIRNDSYF